MLNLCSWNVIEFIRISWFYTHGEIATWHPVSFLFAWVAELPSTMPMIEESYVEILHKLYNQCGRICLKLSLRNWLGVGVFDSLFTVNGEIGTNLKVANLVFMMAFNGVTTRTIDGSIL